VEKTR